MIRTYEVTLHYPLDASTKHTVKVKANTERKAEVLAVEKATREVGVAFHRFNICNIKIIN